MELDVLVFMIHLAVGVGPRMPATKPGLRP
jgi:hypothetical protein